jgi:hypothetical protein
MHDLVLGYDLCIKLAQQSGTAWPKTMPTRSGAGASAKAAYAVDHIAGAAASNIPIGRGLTYVLQPKYAQWAGLELQLGTHNRPATGTLHLRVASANRQALREAVIGLEGLSDNSWLTFNFAPIANSAHATFIVDLWLSGTTAQTRLSLYEMNEAEPRIRQLLRRAGARLSGNQLACRLRYLQEPAAR